MALFRAPFEEMIEIMSEQPEAFSEIITAASDDDKDEPPEADPTPPRSPSDDGRRFIARVEPEVRDLFRSDSERDVESVDSAGSEDGLPPPPPPVADPYVDAASSSSTVAPVPVAPVDPLTTVVYSQPSEGGLVLRNGVRIGKISRLLGGISVCCDMHKCGTVVHSTITIEECARWIDRGTEVPPGATDLERLSLRREHLSVPWPRKPMVWYRP